MTKYQKIYKLYLLGFATENDTKKSVIKLARKKLLDYLINDVSEESYNFILTHKNKLLNNKYDNGIKDNIKFITTYKDYLEKNPVIYEEIVNESLEICILSTNPKPRFMKKLISIWYKYDLNLLMFIKNKQDFLDKYHNYFVNFNNFYDQVNVVLRDGFEFLESSSNEYNKYGSNNVDDFLNKNKNEFKKLKIKGIF